MYGLFYLNGRRLGDLIAVSEKAKLLTEEGKKIGNLIKDIDEVSFYNTWPEEKPNLFIKKIRKI